LPNINPRGTAGASIDMTPDEDYADRKARRQFGQHGHIVLAVMIVIVLAIVRWVAGEMPVP
jgi:hypothetical protein